MGSKNQDQPSGESFESLYKRLEETVARMEQGNLTLEESIALYEEGIKLARRSQEMLSDAELRIARLQESFANGPTIGEDVEDYSPESADEVDLPSE